MDTNIFNLQLFADPNTDDGNGSPAPEAKPEKSFTQAELDQVLKDRLERERKKYADYDELKASREELQRIKDGERTELEKLQAERDKALSELDSLKSTLAKKERDALALKLLTDAGLPAALAPRILGESEEDMQSDIETLKELFPVKKTVGAPTPSDGGGDPSPEEKGKALAEQRQKKKASGFDPWGQ